MPHAREIFARKGGWPVPAVVASAYLGLFLLLTWLSTFATTDFGAVVWYAPISLNFTLLLLFGWRYAPVIFLADFLGKLWILAPHAPLPVLLLGSLELAAVQAVAAAWLRRLIQPNPLAWGLREIAWLAAFLVGTTLVDAGLGILTFTWFHFVAWEQAWFLLFDWWLAGVLGGLNVTPLFLMAARKLLFPEPQGTALRPRGTDWIRNLVQAASIPLTLWFCFRSPLAGEYELLYLCFLPLLWISLRHGLAGAVAATLAINLGAIGLVERYDHQNMPSLQLMMLALSLTGIFLGAVNQQRRRAERGLQASEFRYRLLVDFLPDAVMVHRDGVMVFVNAAAVQMAGANTADDLLGRPIWNMVPPEFKGVVRERARRMLMEGREVPLLEEKILRLDGRTLEIEVKGRPIDYAGGPAALLVIRDISRRKQAEAALQASERLLRLAMDNSPAGFFLYDSDLRIRYLNSFSLKLSGFREEDALGKKDEELFPPEVTQAYLPMLQRALATGESQTAEGVIRSPAGTFFMEYCFVPLLDEIGGVRQIVAILYDISKLKEAETVLRRDKETLEQLVSERTRELVQVQVALEKSRRLSDIGALAAGVAHELRNPLGVIKLAAYNLKQKHPEDRQTSNIEKKIVESERIISNLLTYARIKTPQFETVSLEDIIRECAENTLEKNRGRGVGLDLKLEVLQGRSFRADPFQLREVFSNILDNAFQAAPDQEGRVSVQVRAGGRPGFADIEIHDNGSGIPPEDLPRVFEPFFTRKSRGTGLGLTISQELIQLQNGAISVESPSGQGTTVRVSLPEFNPH